MSHPATNAASDGFRHLSGFMPENGPDLDAFMGGIPEVFTELQQHLAHFADRSSSEMPVNLDVSDILREAAAGISALEQRYQEAYQAWRNSHAEDINRWENPRPAENIMNVP
jgi:hypothetical protein